MISFQRAKRGFEDEKTLVVPWDLIPGQVTVIAKCDIKKGETVTEFDGQFFTEEEFHKATLEEMDCMVGLNANDSLCGLYATRGNGHLINSNYRDVEGRRHRA